MIIIHFIAHVFITIFRLAFHVLKIILLNFFKGLIFVLGLWDDILLFIVSMIQYPWRRSNSAVE